MISDFLPPAITVTYTGGGGGKPGEAADHRLCLSEEQICNCCRKPRLRGSDPDTSATFPRNLRAPELRGLALVRIIICSTE